MPFRQDGKRFGDDEIGAFLREFAGDRGDHVTEPETGKPDLRLACGAEWGACEAGEFFLGGAGGRAADLLAMDEQGHASVVFLESQGVAIWKFGFCEGDAWFHEAIASWGEGLNGCGGGCPSLSENRFRGSNHQEKTPARRPGFIGDF